MATEGRGKTVPEGGRGYLVALAVVIVQLNTLVPLTSFGLVHKGFLTSIGEEASGATTTVSIFFACFSFSAILAGYSVGKLGYGAVGLMGACVHSCATVSQIFVQDLPQFIVCMGLLPGSSSGILIVCVYSSVNEYFKRKLNFVMGSIQILLVLLAIAHSPLMKFFMETIGYTNTKIVLAAMTVLNFLAAWSCFPAKNIKKHTLVVENVNDTEENPSCKTKRNFNFALLKSGKFFTFVVVVACSFYADNLFMPILTMDLLGMNFSPTQVATLCMVFYGGDIAGRIVYLVASYFFSFKNRYLFYAGTLLSPLSRIVFVLRDDYMWRLANLIVMGFLRCSVETPYVPVISEKYREHFPTAYTVSIFIGGLFTLALGALLSLVGELTKDNDLVVQVISAAQLLAASVWTVEFAYKLIRRKGRYKQYTAPPQI